MLFCRTSNILRSSQTLSNKFIFANVIRKCEFNGTSHLFSKISDEVPKRPVSPYLRYFYGILPELTAKFPDASYREKMIMGKDLWHSLDFAKKKSYNESYYEEFDKYKYALLLHECQMHELSEIEEVPIETPTMTKKEKRKLKKMRKNSGKPKRPVSGFILFVKSKRSEIPKTALKNWIADFAREYNNLSEDERRKFQDEAKKLFEQYRKDIIKWEDTLIKTGQTHILYKKCKFNKELT